MLDLSDLIRHPEKYLVDGKPLLSAKLELTTLDGSVFVHRYDHGLQERRVTLAFGVQGMDGAQAAEKLREDTRQHGHCPSCHALHPQHHVNCTRGVKGADHQAFSQPIPDTDGTT